MIVADLHLGYAWAQRRRGQLGPLTEGGVRAKLESAVADTRPRRIVMLGDLVHAPRPLPDERRLVEETVLALAGGRELILVQGNHDRAFRRDFAHLPVEVRPYWTAGGIVAVHGDGRAEYPSSEGQFLVVGHWHPSVSIADSAGATQRLPVFLVWTCAIALPAFSPFAAGFDVSRGLPSGLTDTVPCARRPAELFAASGRRIRKLGRLQPRLRRRRTKPSGDATDKTPAPRLARPSGPA